MDGPSQAGLFSKHGSCPCEVHRVICVINLVTHLCGGQLMGKRSSRTGTHTQPPSGLQHPMSCGNSACSGS
jgi:hypothetical protein